MDNFREWLSDNLRYFMLGGVILIIVAVLFFSIRACTGSGKGTSDGEQTTAQDNSQGNDPSSPEDKVKVSVERKSIKGRGDKRREERRRHESLGGWQ